MGIGGKDKNGGCVRKERVLVRKDRGGGGCGQKKVELSKKGKCKQGMVV